MTLPIDRMPTLEAWEKFQRVPPPVEPQGWRKIYLSREEALRMACEAAGLTVEQAKSPTRAREIAYRRGYAALLLLERNWSTTRVGQAFNRGHSAISYLTRRVTFLRGLN